MREREGGRGLVGRCTRAIAVLLGWRGEGRLVGRCTRGIAVLLG